MQLPLTVITTTLRTVMAISSRFLNRITSPKRRLRRLSHMLKLKRRRYRWRMGNHHGTIRMVITRLCQVTAWELTTNVRAKVRPLSPKPSFDPDVMIGNRRQDHSAFRAGNIWQGRRGSTCQSVQQSSYQDHPCGTEIQGSKYHRNQGLEDTKGERPGECLVG
jgi:hypothetical protein